MTSAADQEKGVDFKDDGTVEDKDLNVRGGTQETDDEHGPKRWGVLMLLGA